MNHLRLRLEIEQKELNFKVDNHERQGSLIRDWAHLSFHPWREIPTSLQESIEMHENDIERDSLRLVMHRALILPLWWMRCHHTPWSILAWKIEIRVWEKFPTNWDESSWANHDHEMRISWAWWGDDLGLHVFTLSSTFISNLHFLSLVLPCSCSFRERKVRNGRMGWVGNCFSWWSHLPFRAYDMWGQGLSGGQLIPHSLHVVRVLTDGSVWRRTVRYSLLVERWIQTLGIWHWGQLTLFQRSITWPLTFWANMVHLSDCRSPYWVGRQCICGFCYVQKLAGLI
jgi:hypothetical protein